jgi:hypothetical protein
LAIVTFFSGFRKLTLRLKLSAFDISGVS